MRFPLIIGLGNPGRQYEETRHNIGFMVLDRLAAQETTPFVSSPKWRSHIAKLRDGTWLVKPQTFMNLSGEAARKIAAFHKWNPEEILVIYDDTALPLGSLRFREKGSAGGHNGIKSLIAHFSTDHFPRLKVGIGASTPGNMVGHVLGTFSQHEQDSLENTLATACNAVQLARSQGIAAAANRFNTTNKSTLPRKSDEPQIQRPDCS